MSLVRAALIQAHLGITGQVELAGNTGVIDERYDTHFCIVIRRDTHSPPGFDVAVPAAELGPVDMKFDIILIGRPAERLRPSGPPFAARQISDVAKLAPTIAGSIFPPTSHVHVAPSTPSTPGGSDHDGVPAVGQQPDVGVRRIRKLPLPCLFKSLLFSGHRTHFQLLESRQCNVGGKRRTNDTVWNKLPSENSSNFLAITLQAVAELDGF